jgi:hypothetical protein
LLPDKIVFKYWLSTTIRSSAHALETKWYPATLDTCRLYLSGFMAWLGSGVEKLGSGVVGALELMDASADTGDSTGGARFVMVMSDGLEIEDIVETGLRRYADKYGLKLPLTGVHVIGVAIPKADQLAQWDSTPLDDAACAQVR